MKVVFTGYFPESTAMLTSSYIWPGSYYSYMEWVRLQASLQKKHFSLTNRGNWVHLNNVTRRQTTISLVYYLGISGVLCSCGKFLYEWKRWGSSWFTKLTSEASSTSLRRKDERAININLPPRPPFQALKYLIVLGLLCCFVGLGKGFPLQDHSCSCFNEGLVQWHHTAQGTGVSKEFRIFSTTGSSRLTELLHSILVEKSKNPLCAFIMATFFYVNLSFYALHWCRRRQGT